MPVDDAQAADIRGLLAKTGHKVTAIELEAELLQTLIDCRKALSASDACGSAKVATSVARLAEAVVSSRAQTLKADVHDREQEASKLELEQLRRRLAEAEDARLAAAARAGREAEAELDERGVARRAERAERMRKLGLEGE